MNETPLTALPEHWQEHIKHLRADRADLLAGGYPAAAKREIRGLRRQVAKMRIQRNEARAELEALRAERA